MNGSVTPRDDELEAWLGQALVVRSAPMPLTKPGPSVQEMPPNPSAGGNPLGASQRLRAMMLGVPFCYFVVTGTLALLNNENSSVLAYLGVLLLATVMFAPAAMMPGIGPAHVLVFPALWWFANLAGRQTTTVVSGLSEHVALPGVTASELNLLFAQLQLLTAVGHAALILGYFLFRKPAAPLLEVRPATFIRAKTLIIIGCSAIVLALYERLVGGFEGMLLIRGMNRVMRDELRGGGHFTVLLSIPVFLSYLLYAIWPLARKSPLFWATFGFALASSFLVSGSRAALFYPLIILLLIHYLLTGNLPKLPLVASVIGAWLLIGMIGIFRTEHFGAKSVDWGLFSDYEIGDYFDASSTTIVTRATQRYGSLPALYYVPDDQPLLLGSTYLRVLLAPFPQALLPFDKPLAAGRLNGQTFFSIDAGVPCGPIIEAYWNFHVPGVIILYFILGVISAYVHRWYIANRSVAGAAAFYVLFIFYFKFESDALVQFIQATVIIFCLFVFFCGFPRLRGRRPDLTPSP